MRVVGCGWVIGTLIACGASEASPPRDAGSDLTRSNDAIDALPGREDAEARAVEDASDTRAVDDASDVRVDDLRDSDGAGAFDSTSGCGITGEPCADGAECCSGRCSVDGVCIPVVCAVEGAPCTVGSECCNRTCAGNRCVGACTEDGELCVRDDECCNRSCKGGYCEADPRVIPGGVPCGIEPACNAISVCCIEQERGIRLCRTRDCPVISYVPYECDGPEDCRPGLHCCAELGIVWQPTTCRESCLPTQGERCHTASECPSEAPLCCDFPRVSGGASMRRCAATRPDETFGGCH